MSNETAGDLISGTERHALLNEVVSAVGGVDEALCGSLAHVVLVQGHCFKHGDKRSQAELEIVHCVEYRFLILLHVLVVGERQTLHHGKECHIVADNAGCLAADKLGNVRIFLLGHNAGAGGEAVGKFDELEFPAAPHDYFLGEAGEVHHAD